MLLSISSRTARAPALVASLALLVMAMPMVIAEIGGGALTCVTGRAAPSVAPPAPAAAPADAGPGAGAPPGGGTPAAATGGAGPSGGPFGERAAGISPAVSLWLDGIGDMSGGTGLPEGRSAGSAEAGATGPVRRPRSTLPVRVRSASTGGSRNPAPARGGFTPSPAGDPAASRPGRGDAGEGGGGVATESNAPYADDGTGEEE